MAANIERTRLGLSLAECGFTRRSSRLHAGDPDCGGSVVLVRLGCGIRHAMVGSGCGKKLVEIPI